MAATMGLFDFFVECGIHSDQGVRLSSSRKDGMAMQKPSEYIQ